jgi:hypothetical protein
LSCRSTAAILCGKGLRRVAADERARGVARWRCRNVRVSQRMRRGWRRCGPICVFR